MPHCTRRLFVAAGLTGLLRGDLSSQRPPNIVVILADDLGYGDLGCFGSSMRTPNLDKLAHEGMRLERFYSASPVCSPSRAALLTGKYPARTAVTNVLMPDSKDGLRQSERTIPKVLAERGYRCAAIGKWHLGTVSDCQPNRLGFHEFRGIPYSNDMNPLPYLRNTDVADASPPQQSLTERFTRDAVDFINRHREQPFFLYLAHTAPHIPLAPSARFRGRSGNGVYGDVVQELDWSVGEIVSALEQNGLNENTLVFFTSDNGPWYQGSTGPLKGRKGSTFEGGVRVPTIARWTGRIAAGSVSTALASSMDLLPTFAALAGNAHTQGVDGVDLWPVLSGQSPHVDREPLLFFDEWDVQCVRWGPWKLHLARHNSVAWTMDPEGGRWNLPLPQLELYNIDADPSESWDQAPEQPEIVADLKKRVEQMLPSFPPQVLQSWRDTQSRRVMATPVGSLPRPEN